MTVAIETQDRAATRRVIEAAPHVNLDEIEKQKIDACLAISTHVYLGLVDGEYACCWGLIPPTVMGDRAYLWLHTSSLVEQNKFVFVRRSQRCIEAMLKEYSEIVGFCKPGNEQAIRWIKWLGAEFAEPARGRVDFVIRRKPNG